MVQQIEPVDHHALAQHQRRQHAPFERGEAQGESVEFDLPRLRIERHRAALNARRGIAGRAADQRAQPHDEFLDAERLGQIIVGPGAEPRDLFRPAVACGEDQHGQRAPGGAPFLQHGDARFDRQAEIEHRRIIAAGIAEMRTILAIRGDIDCEMFRPQGFGDAVGERGVVLDQQDAHGCVL